MKWTNLFVLVLFFPTFSTASLLPASPPAPLPIFLRIGFSSVLEFENPPIRVILGDSQAFQIERLDRSLVLRTLLSYATTNMFVYFKDTPPRLFVLTASEDAEPTYFKKFENPKAAAPPNKGPATSANALLRPLVSEVLSATFDARKDYLTVEVRLAADSSKALHPAWVLVRLRHQSKFESPFKLWSERKEVQKDTAIHARFIFAKPNIPKDLSNTVLIIPMDGQSMPLSFSLKKVKR